MNIKSLKVSRSPNLVWLTFDNGKYIPIPADDIYRYSLKKGDLVDDSKLIVLFRSSFSYLLNEFALRQIALSSKSEKVIRQKLRLKYLKIHQKYQPPQLDYQSLIDNIVQRLNQQNLLDEASYIESLIRKKNHKSSGYLKQLLLSQGVNWQKYQHLFDQSGDIEKIKKLIPRLGSDQKAISKLIRRGFSLNSIKKAIDDCTNSR